MKVLVIGAAAIFAAGTLWAFSPAGTNERDARLFEVAQGWGTARIAAELKAAGLIRSELAFIFYTRVTGVASRLQAGTYAFSQGMTPMRIASLMARGEAVSDDHEVTIPEGLNVWEIDRLLTTAGIIKAGELRSGYSHKEGHLFPETYRFAKNATVDDVVRKMEATYFERGPGEGSTGGTSGGISSGTRGDIDLIVASMLEKEAKSPEDMALVAGIMFRRMEIGMLLQIDATVGYGWCVRTRGYSRDCDVTQAPIATEIKIDGPYNTYTRGNVPRAAISNPGEAALRAAANPTKSDYLYYLSTRDGSQLIYSKTLDEHLENRQKYLGF